MDITVTLDNKLKAVGIAYSILRHGVGGEITQTDVDGAREFIRVLMPQIITTMALEVA